MANASAISIMPYTATKFLFNYVVEINGRQFTAINFLVNSLIMHEDKQILNKHFFAPLAAIAEAKKSTN